VGWKRDEYEGLVLAVGDGAIRLASRPFNSISEFAYGLERVVEYASTTESMLCNKALIVSRHKEATKRSAAFFLYNFIFLLPE
jgi:predicted ATP-grasp superfamily ATP-dependent carboligase